MTDELQCTTEAIADFATYGFQSACAYAQAACADETTIIDMFSIYYCTLNQSLALFIPFSILIVFFIFYMIASTAEDYLEPVVSKISTKLKLSESLAGVTLVALANGAPDVIAAFAAGGNEDQGVLVPLGGLLGAGVFTIAIILAVCILFSPTKMIATEKQALRRDCVFYLFGTLYVLALGIYGEINIWGAMGFFVQYLVFIVVVLYQEAQYRKAQFQKAIMSQDGPSFVLAYGKDIEFQGEDNLLNSLVKKNHLQDESVYVNDVSSEVKSCSVSSKKMVAATGTNLQWRYAILKHNAWKEFEELEGSTIIGKILYVLLYPLKLVRDLTIPATCCENWSKWKAVLMPFCIYPFFVWQAGFFEMFQTPMFLYFSIAHCVVISLVIWKFTTTQDCPESFFGFIMMGLAFSSCVVWINLIANILVDFIALLSVFTDLPLNYLGLTLVAFGGSVPDFFVDLTMAKKGLGQTAASGIFAGQYFNIGIGFGASLTRTVLTYGTQSFKLLDTSNTSIINMILLGCLAGGLIVALIYGHLNNYVYKKGFAIYSLLLYGGFLVSVTLLSF